MKPYFIEPGEKTQAVLGINACNYYEQTGRMGSGFCVASDKRVYFKGTSYYGGGYKKTVEDRVVDIHSIKGSGFSLRRKMSTVSLVICLLAAIIIGIVGVSLFVEAQGKSVWLGGNAYYEYSTDTALQNFAIGLLIVTGILLLIVFIGFVNKQRIFWIAFEGGVIAYNAMYFSENEITEFQKQLNIAKENYMSMYPVQPTQYAQPVQYAEPTQYAQPVQYTEPMQYTQPVQYAEPTQYTQPVQCAEPMQNVQSIQPMPTPQYNSMTDELMKCKNLLDSGAISPEEYEQMKKKILEMNNF